MKLEEPTTGISKFGGDFIEDEGNPAAILRLKEQKACYLNALKKSDRCIVFIDENGVVQDVNELFYEYFNVEQDYLIGKRITVFGELFTPPLFKYEEFFRQLKEEGRAETLSHYEQSPGVISYYRMVAFFDEDADIYILRVADETELINLKEQLAHKSMLSETVQLAASVVHEIRNPLTTLKGFTQLLGISATGESKKYLSVIDDEIVRMESILNELLLVSQPQEDDKEIVSLKDILSKVLYVISAKASLEGITIVEKEVTFTDINIYGNENKLKQVLFNLLKNALESMTPGGILTTELTIGEDGSAKLTIEDTGKGIGAEQLSQIFTPYFTTRSEGTGLGLSFVAKVVEDYEGTITANSEVGIGTKFTLSFPPKFLLRSNGTVDERVLSAIGSMA